MAYMTRSRARLSDTIPSVEQKVAAEVPPVERKAEAASSTRREKLDISTERAPLVQNKVTVAAVLASIQHSSTSLRDFQVPVSMNGKLYGMMSAVFFNQCSSVPYGKYVTSIDIRFKSKTATSSIISFILGAVNVTDEEEIENVKKDLTDIMDQLGLNENIRWN